MRLIDADELLQEIRENMPNYEVKGEFLNYVNEQPTAYDVSRVVEQLESLSNAEADYYYATSNDVIDRENAIDIVKRGGVE